MTFRRIHSTRDLTNSPHNSEVERLPRNQGDCGLRTNEDQGLQGACDLCTNNQHFISSMNSRWIFVKDLIQNEYLFQQGEII